MTHDEDDFEQDQRPSRSQRKREAHALRDLGAELVELSPERLKGMPLSEELFAAVREAQRISARGGRRRQLQLIGKLLRQEDAAPIEQALARLDQQSASARAEHQLAERWRERLLEQGDEALADFLREHPDADPQRLRQLVRAAHREQRAGKPPKSARELFRAVRAALG